MKNLSFLNSVFGWILPPKTSLSSDLTDAIAHSQRQVIQKRLEAIAKDFEAQGVLAQLQYLQSIDLSHEKTLSSSS